MLRVRSLISSQLRGYRLQVAGCKKVILATCLLVLFFGGNLYAQDATDKSKNDLAEYWFNWAEYYYVEKDPKQVGDAINYLQNENIIEELQAYSYVRSFGAFFGEIFKDNPDKVLSWCKQNKYSRQTKEILQYALWLSGNKEKIKDIFGDLPEYAKENPIDLTTQDLTAYSNVEVTSLGEKRIEKRYYNFDMINWAFLGSGNPQYIHKIIDAISSDKIDKEFRKHAEIGLAYLIIKNEIVNRIVQKEIAGANPSVKQKLQAIVDMAHKNDKPLPNKDGDFSAMLVLSDAKKSQSEFGKPSYKEVHIAEKIKAKVGDEVIINILFAGQELKEDLQADVTFDLQILDPEGGVYDNSDVKDMAALQQKVPLL